MSPPDTVVAKKPAAAPPAKALPYTGKEYLESLDDGREIWIYGERVKKITDASGVSELRAHARAPLRRAARGPPTRQGRPHRCPPSGAASRTGTSGRRRTVRSRWRARRDRRVGARHLRLARPLARLQGGVPGDARRQRRVLRAVPGQRPPLVPVLPGARPVHQPRDHPSAGRPQHGAGRARRPPQTSTRTSPRRRTPASTCPAPRSWRRARR